MNSVTKLLGNRILVQFHEKNGKDGIFIPEVHKEKPDEGEVILVGSTSEEPELQVGKTVRVDRRYGSVEVTHNGHKCHIVSVKDVLAVFE